MRAGFGSDWGRQLGADRKAAVNLDRDLRTFCGDCMLHAPQNVRRMLAMFS